MLGNETLPEQRDRERNVNHRQENGLQHAFAEAFEMLHPTGAGLVAWRLCSWLRRGQHWLSSGLGGGRW